MGGRLVRLTISGARAILNISYEEAAGRFVQIDKGSFARPLEANLHPVRTLLQRYEALEEITDRR